MRVLCAPKKPISAVAFSPDGALLAEAAHGGTVRVWDLATGEVVHAFEASGRFPNQVRLAFSPDGATLAVVNEKAELIDLASGERSELPTRPARLSPFNGICYSPDGRRIAAGGDERVIRRIPWWYGSLLVWLTQFAPVDFGLRRSRWSCEALALVLCERVGVALGRESVRCVLHEMGFVWRRPRPVVGPSDPDHEPKMRAIRELLANLPANEVAVFQDEVQLDLNPKIGSAWVLEGIQQEVVTPGDNVRRHLAVSMLAGSGRLVVSGPAARRNSAQFMAHLGDLCRRLRHWKVIHVICDNAAFHKSRVVQRWVASRAGRVVLHYLPSRAPEENPVELVFWRLHETITRNHRHETINQLVEAATEWLEVEGAGRPPIETYNLAA